jgi:peptidoglycan/LPS O-acetylase OafA/YrhL
LRYYNLQFARFLGAVFVLFFHKLHTGILWLDFIIGKGDISVSFFFILSGFVVSTSLIRKEITFKEYIINRSKKIFPHWHLSIILCILAAGTMSVSSKRFMLSTVLLQSLFPDYALDINFVGWSLSIEIIMYVLLFYIIKKINVKSLGYVFHVIFIWLITQIIFLLFLTKDIELSRSINNIQSLVYYHPIWHLSSFLLGTLCAIYIDTIKIPALVRFSNPAFLLTFIYVIILFVFFYMGNLVGLPRFYHNGFFAPMTGFFIILICYIEKEKNLQTISPKNRLFDKLGEISFGIYLYHIPIYNILNNSWEIGNNGWHFWFYFMIVLFFSFIAHLILNKISNRITNKIVHF